MNNQGNEGGKKVKSIQQIDLRKCKTAIDWLIDFNNHFIYLLLHSYYTVIDYVP